MAPLDLATLEAVFLVAMGGWLIVLGGAFLLSQRTVDRASAILLALAGVYAILWQQPALLGMGEALHIAIAQPVFVFLLSGAIFLWTYWLFERHVDQLERSHEDLEEALSLERTLVDVLSHDLRNSLASAKLSLQRLRRGAPELTGSLDAVLDDIRSAQEVMDNGLVYSRLSTPDPSARPPEHEAVDLMELVEAAVDRCTRQTGTPGIDIEIEGPDTLPIEVNPLMESAVQNLLDNAVKFSPSEAEVLVRVQEDGDDAVLSVVDEGPGIPHADRERLFERFEHGDGEAVGEGLGMAIIHRLVELHDGEIEVDETPGGGTTVTIRLPRRRASEPLTEMHETRSTIRGQARGERS